MYTPPPGTLHSHAGMKQQNTLPDWQPQQFNPFIEIPEGLTAEEREPLILARWGKFAGHGGGFWKPGDTAGYLDTIMDHDSGWFTRTGRGIPAGTITYQEERDAPYCDPAVGQVALAWRATRTVGFTPLNPGPKRDGWSMNGWAYFAMRNENKRTSKGDIVLTPVQAKNIRGEARELILYDPSARLERRIPPTNSETLRYLYTEKGEFDYASAFTQLWRWRKGRRYMEPGGPLEWVKEGL